MTSPAASRTQERVRAAMERVGGYWRPLAATARLLEELGELAENLAHRDPDHAEIEAELADLWIITAAMSDQFLGWVAEPPGPGAGSSEHADLPKLVATAGQLARIVNYYDGPKGPRTLEGWTPLNDAVATFHRALGDVSAAQQVDLRGAVDRKLNAIPARDAGRFARTHDPSTAQSLAEFRAVQTTTQCPFAEQARLWGSPAWSLARPFESNVEAIVPTLTTFTKAALAERLDAYIISGPSFESMKLLAGWFRQLLSELARHDPADERVMDGRLDRVGWQFAFNRQRMFVAVFSPLYSPHHPRHSPSRTFVFLQTEESFDRRGVGSAHPESARVKARVRRRFEEASRAYPHEAKDARVEPPLYLLPRWDGDVAVRWWETQA